MKSLLLLLTAFSLPPALAKKPIEKIDSVYLYPALPLSYRLPEDLRDKKLLFTGNYKKNTKAVHRIDRNDILFTPTRIGASVLVVRDSKRQILTRLIISVQKDNLHKIAAELRELLISVDGIEIKIYNNKIIIDGQILLPIEMDRIKKITADYDPKIVKSYVSYSPLAQKKIAELLEKEIEYPELQIRYAYNRFLLEGCVNTQAEKNRALTIANLYTQYEVNPVGRGAGQKSIAPLQHNIKVPCESAKKNKEKKTQEEKVKKLIQIVVHFVDMSKSFEKTFFFQWTPAITGNNTQVTGSIGNNPQLASGITAVLTATVSNFLPKLNWAKKFNFARVLHNSSLLMEEGYSGSISTQTVAPQSTSSEGVISGGGIGAQVTVRVTPKIQGKGNIIQLQTNINVSAPADVGTATRSIDTKINVRDGASAVVGGLTSSYLSRSYNNKPNQLDDSSTPILNLYKGKNYSTKKDQFIVFITPIIKSSASVGVDRVKKKFKLDE